MKHTVKLKQKDGKLYNIQSIGSLKGSLKTTKNWGAIITGDPNSHWGCNREFLSFAKERDYAYHSKNIKKGDRLQFKVEQKNKTVYPAEAELNLYGYVIEVDENFIELITYNSLSELLDDLNKDEATSPEEK